MKKILILLGAIMLLAGGCKQTANPQAENENSIPDSIQVINETCLILIFPETRHFEDEDSDEAQEYFAVNDDFGWYAAEISGNFEKLGISTNQAEKRYLSFVIDNGENQIIDTKAKDVFGALLYKKGKAPISIYLVLSDWKIVADYLQMEQSEIMKLIEADVDTDARLLNDLSQFVPEGYVIFDTISGDLNLDQYADRLMILKKNGGETDEDRRPLLILLGQEDNTCRLAVRNDNVVLGANYGGATSDPYVKMTINKGSFSVEFNGGSSSRWIRIITFKYSPDDNYWFLHEDSEEGYSTFDPDNRTSGIKTAKDFGKVRFDEFDIWQTHQNSFLFLD
ncbi:hypothetical protein [Dysgonomonas reticulitermitis]